MSQLKRTRCIRRSKRAIFVLASQLIALSCCVVSIGTEPARWSSEISIRQFRIHSDFELSATEDLVAELDAMSFSIEQLLGSAVEPNAVHIVLFQTEAEYRRYMQNYFPKLPQRRALFIQDRGPGMLFTHWHQDVATDLRHEVTHALLNQTSNHLPLWLDEGLAEYYEVAAERRFQGCEYLKPVASQTQRGIVPPLEQLEAQVVQAEFGDTNYRDSWAWVHFMLHRSRETRKLLVDYIHGVRSGSEQLELSRQLNALLPDLNAEFKSHFAAVVVEPNES